MKNIFSVILLFMLECSIVYSQYQVKSEYILNP